MEIFSNGGIISLSEMDIFESRLGDGGEHKEQVLVVSKSAPMHLRW